MTLGLSNEEIAALPVDRLAYAVLEFLAATNEWNSYNFLNAESQNREHRRDHATLGYLTEAIWWLRVHGLIAHPKPGQSHADSMIITRAGRAALDSGLAPVIASARLTSDLHPRLAAIPTQYLLGEYELAAFAALREVEIRVREMSGLPDSMLGKDLMRQAFAVDRRPEAEPGPLTDTGADKGEQQGLSDLFAGAIATFKNPPSHRRIDYSDPTEASEVVLLADLLMRILDRVDSTR